MTTAERLASVWAEMGEAIVNNIKVHVLKNHVTDVVEHVNPKIDYLVRRYARFLPRFVAESEMDDLKTVSQLEFIETLKVWVPDRNTDIWPLAQARILGAMKDHIRHITRSDPSRFYDWVADAAHLYLTVNNRADFETSVEDGVQLSQAMEVLSERERKILIAHVKDDLTFKDIGLRLGISESQTSRIYKKCLEKLKFEMKRDRTKTT